MCTIINEREASKVLNIAAQTLRNWRYLQKGPPYIRAGGAIRYKTEDLKSWVDKKRIDPEQRAT